MNNFIDKPSINVVIDHDRIRTKGPEKGKAHVKVVMTFRVIENGKKKWPQRPYKTGLFCTVDEFRRVMDDKDKRLPTMLLDLRSKINAIRARASHIIDELGATDQQTFESYFLSNHSVEDIAGHFEAKIQELRLTKPRPKISSAEKYETALKSLQEFFGEGVIITFNMLTPEKLQEYEDWYTDQPVSRNSPVKKSLTSVGINLRCVRHIFKRVIKKGVISSSLFPFGVGLYVIPEGGDDTKKFLDQSEKNLFVNWRHKADEHTINNIIEFRRAWFGARGAEEYPDFATWPHNRKDALYYQYAEDVVSRRNELHDYTLFSYYGFGMNMSDLARLRRNRVFKDYISIDRQKTKGRKKKQKSTIIPLHPVMKDIINRRGKKSLIPNDYVFPILDYGMDEESIFYCIREFVNELNDLLSIIAKECGFEIKPTTYTLRHTFSFNFMAQGATTEELQDALAHGSKQTTENYKHGFALEQKKKYSEGL